MSVIHLNRPGAKLAGPSIVQRLAGIKETALESAREAEGRSESMSAQDFLALAQLASTMLQHLNNSDLGSL